MSDQIEIKLPDLSRVALEPGDVLLVRVAHQIDQSTAHAIKEAVKSHFPGHDVAVLGQGAELSVVRPLGDTGVTVPTLEES